MLKVGSDPEIFLWNPEQGLLDPATITTGSKEEPEAVGDGVSFHVDNVCLEYTHAPCATRDEWEGTHQVAREKLSERLSGGSTPMFSPVTEMTTASLTHFGIEAELFRCHPDQGVWSKPSYADLGMTRVSGGHVHLGWGEDGEVWEPSQWQSIMLSDYLIGLWGVLHEQPSAAKRRQFYGQAGSFRPCPYGAEYRTPSNFWVADPSLTGEMFDRAIKVMELTLDQDAGATLLRTQNPDEVVAAINSCDRQAAQRLLTQIEKAA